MCLFKVYNNKTIYFPSNPASPSSSQEVHHPRPPDPERDGRQQPSHHGAGGAHVPVQDRGPGRAAPGGPEIHGPLGERDGPAGGRERPSGGQAHPDRRSGSESGVVQEQQGPQSRWGTFYYLQKSFNLRN